MPKTRLSRLEVLRQAALASGLAPRRGAVGLGQSSQTRANSGAHIVAGRKNVQVQRVTGGGPRLRRGLRVAG